MIENISKVKVTWKYYDTTTKAVADGSAEVSLTGTTSADTMVGADLDYGFYPSRSGWTKIGSYVNFGITNFSLTLKSDCEAFNTLMKAPVTVNGVTYPNTIKISFDDADAIAFDKLSNYAKVTYPADVQVGVKYPELVEYLRLDFMVQPKN